MTNLRQAAQQALEALEDLGMRHFENTGEKLYADIYIALRNVLEQQAEPVHGDIRALKYRIHELEGEVMGYKRMLDVAEAASQPQQQAEPVAWQVMVEDEAMKEFPIKDMAYDWCIQQKLSGSSYVYWIRPLYTIPPQPLAQPISFAGLTLTEVRVPFGMTVRFEGRALIVETVHNVKEEKTPAFISCDAHGNIISKEHNND